MTRDKPERKPRSRGISARGRAIIDERAAKARPRQLIELQTIARHRGRVTDRELSAVADVLSHIHPPDAVAGALAEWLAGAGDEPARTTAWLSTAAGRDCIARAEADLEDHIVTMRRTTGVKAIRAAWSITEEEVERLGLVDLVGNARRLLLRRRAEGVRPAEEARAERTAKVAEPNPWELDGISKSAYYKRLKRATVAAVRAAAGETETDPEPWLSAGVSRATYFRRLRADRETRKETRSDHIRFEEARTGEEVHTGFPQPDLPALPHPLLLSLGNRVGPSLPMSLTEQVPAASAFPTAEARRLRALALRLGLFWHGGEDPRNWFSAPPGHLSNSQQDTLDAAVQATLASLSRRDAIEHARATEALRADIRTPAQREADFRAKLTAEEDERRAADERGDRPARVSEHVWDAVPPELRSRTRVWAGRFFLSGEKPDDALLLAVDAARREALIADRVLEADRSASIEDVHWLIVAGPRSGWWRLPTAEAVGRVLAKLRGDREALATALSEASAAADRDPLLTTGERQAVIENAGRLLVGFPGTSPADAVRQARDGLRRYSSLDD